MGGSAPSAECLPSVPATEETVKQTALLQRGCDFFQFSALTHKMGHDLRKRLQPVLVGTAWAVQNRVKMAHFAVQRLIRFLFQRRKGSVTAL